jgi:hypothetical protein
VIKNAFGPGADFVQLGDVAEGLGLTFSFTAPARLWALARTSTRQDIETMVAVELTADFDASDGSGAGATDAHGGALPLQGHQSVVADGRGRLLSLRPAASEPVLYQLSPAGWRLRDTVPLSRSKYLGVAAPAYSSGPNATLARAAAVADATAAGVHTSRTLEVCQLWVADVTQAGRFAEFPRSQLAGSCVDKVAELPALTDAIYACF